MAGFNGRRAPNVSQYIANLNTIQPAHDPSTQQDENYNLDDDLAVFTNAEFFDFDLGGEGIEQPTVNYDRSQEERARRENAAAHKNSHNKMEFVNENYTFPELPPFLAANSPTTSHDPAYHPAPAFANPTLATSFPYPPPSSTSGSSITPANHLPLTSPTATTSTPTSPSPSHFAAEEDKRRRNTAASARFRIKKKQREQALERTAKELGDRAKELEKRLGQLETENEWLRGLVVERNGVVNLESVARDRGAAAEKDKSEKDKRKGVGGPEAA